MNGNATINMLDPLMWQWIVSTSTITEHDGTKFLQPLKFWPDGQPIIYIGVMADEVQQNYPDMVQTGPNGFLYVDFAKLIRALGEETN